MILQVLLLPLKVHTNDSTVNFLVSGEDIKGNSISETIAGTDKGIAIGSKEFKKITSVTVKDNATSGKVELGFIHELFAPKGYGTASVDHDFDEFTKSSPTAKQTATITVDHLFGQKLN